MKGEGERTSKEWKEKEKRGKSNQKAEEPR